MAYINEPGSSFGAEKASIGDLISGTFGELRENFKPILVYLGVFVLLNLFGDSNALSFGLSFDSFIPLVYFAVYFLAQYWLYEHILRGAGLVEEGKPKRVFRFFGMAVVIGIALSFANSFFVIPAVILCGRWITAPSFLVASDCGVFESIGESWRTSSGNTLSLSVAAFVMGLIFILLFTVLSALEDALFGWSGDGIFTNLAFHILPLLLMGLSITAYRRFAEPDANISDVFS